MKRITLAITLFYLLCTNTATLHAEEASFECQGYTTIIYSNKDIAIAVCHAPYTKIKRNLINQWQDCVDATIYMRHKKISNNIIHTDCSPVSHKEFKMVNDALIIKHYYDEHPGFKLVPFIIESHDIKSTIKSYKLITNFKKYTRGEIDSSVNDIEKIATEPFNGSQYFNVVYGGFFKLRAYSAVAPDYVLKTLNSYINRGIFDGEVSETPNSIIEDAKLIKLAIQTGNNE